MSILFIPILVIHVVVAVLGLGSLLSVAVVAGIARRVERVSTDVTASLATLLRYSAVSLGAMFATGVLMDVVTGGTFHDWWWFRGSALMFVAIGALHARARRMIRLGLGTDERDAILRRLERIAYGMCALVAAITILMEAKPF
jgi:hypothetical protein